MPRNEKTRNSARRPEFCLVMQGISGKAVAWTWVIAILVAVVSGLAHL